MCGKNIQLYHAAVIGPAIVLSAYMEWKVPLYVLGFGAIALHSYYLFTDSTPKGKRVTPGYQHAATVGTAR